MSNRRQQLEQILALVGLYLHSGKTEDALRLLERVKSKFVQEESNWTLAYAQALIAHGDPEKALALAHDAKKPHVARNIRTLALHEISQRSGEWQPFVEHLETSFAETQDGELLLALCQFKAHHKEWAYVADHADTLVQLVETADAVRLATYAAWHAERFQQCLQLLTEHLPLFPEKVLPLDLRRMQVHCQTRLGALSQAVAHAEDLVRQDDTTEHILTLIDIQMQKGDLKGLALTARRLISREDLSSRNLLRIARLVFFDDPELAKHFWHCVLVREDVMQEPDLLQEALSLGFKLGLDAETAPLVARMQEFAMQGKGSFQLFSLKALPSMTQNQAKYRDHVQQKYHCGEVPIHFGAEKLNIPLAHLFHSLLEYNRKAPAPWSQPIIWARHGGRPLYEQPLTSEHWRLHLDVTALLLAADLDILEKVEQCFAPLRIVTALPITLVRQHDMLTPHQPSRLAGYRRLLQLFQDGRVQPIPQNTDATAGPAELIDKMGADWVALLEKAKTEGGFIVDYLSLTSNNLEAEPITLPDHYCGHIINCRALIQSLRDNGHFSVSTYQEALHALGSEGAVDAPSAVPEIGAKVFLVANIAAILADANLLELVSRHFKVFVNPRSLDEARNGLQADEHREELTVWLGRLIDRVREGLDRGVYEGIDLPDDTARAEFEREEAETPDFLSLTSLLYFRPQKGDVIWVDDRWVNGHAHRDGVPIIGVNEVLRALLQRGYLQENEYYATLLKLRATNVRYVPLEVGEIHYHLQQAQVSERTVVETAELSVLRRYIAACLLDESRLQRPPMPQGASNPEGEIAFVLGIIRTTVEAMIDCWSDEKNYGDRTEPYADWILENLYTGLFGVCHLRSDPDPDSDGLDLIGHDIGNGLVRGFSLRGNLHATEENISPRQKFFHWLESRIIMQRFQADPDAVVAVANTLKKVLEELASRRYDDQEQDIASRLLLQRYFLELPENIGNTLQLDPEVMARLGVTIFDSVMIGSLCFERTEFYEAVAHALHGQEGRVTERTLRTEYTLIATRDNGAEQQVIEIKDQMGVVVETSHDPMMGLLLDDPRARQEWLRLHRSWFDCSIDEFEKAVAEITSAEKPLERVEKARGWWETSAAVFYSRIEQQLKDAGRFSRDDLLPPSATGLLRHFRLDNLVDDADFQDRLQKAAKTFIEEEGLESAIGRLGCLPVKLPTAFVEACDRLISSERQEFFDKLSKRWASPVYKLHLIDLALRYASDNPFCLDLARSMLRELFDETNGTLHYRLFAAMLSFVNDGFGSWAETASWPVSAKLAMIWAHASRLHNIFMAAHILPEQLAQWFERAQHHVISAEIFGREPAFWDDMLHPRRVNRMAFLIHGVAAILAGHDSAIIGQLGIRDVLLNTGFPEANGSRSPHIDLLHDPGLARNVLGSFFGGNRTAILERCLGSEPANTLASSNLHDIVKQAIQNLKIDPCQQSEWAKIGMIIGDLPMYADSRTEFRILLDSLDFGALNAVDPMTASLALDVAASQIAHLVDEDLRSRCQAGLLAIVRFQARHDSRSTTDLLLTDLLLTDAFWLSIKPGDLRGTSKAFAQLVRQMFDAWPQLAKIFGPGLSSLVKELPARQLHGLWPLVLRVRAYDGPI